MNLVAAILCGHDNDTYMVASCRARLYDVPASVFCTSCGWKTDWSFVRPDYQLGRKRPDISATYDGVTIISTRARDIFGANGIDSAICVPLPMEPDHFALVPDTIVPFDCERRRTTRESLCATCGLHAVVAGATPAFFKSLPNTDSWVARSDVLFGSYNEHSPLIVVSHLVGQALSEARLSGLNLNAIKAEHVASNRSLASTLKSTSPVRGSEDLKR